MFETACIENISCLNDRTEKVSFRLQFCLFPSMLLYQHIVAKKEMKHSCKTKNTKTRKNFNNFIENKEVKSLNNWVCIKMLIWKKNVLCLVVVGLLDLHSHGQSDVTSVERREVVDDLQLSCFLQSGEEDSQCGWCMVLSFAYLSLSLSLRAGVLVCGCHLPSFDLALLLRNLSFIAFLPSNWIKLGFFHFLPWRSWICRKITFNYFYFLTNFINILLCTDPMRRSSFSILKKVSALITSSECSRGC